MLLTTNYKMKKIELKDSPPDITVINSNWDWLDTMIKTLHDSTNTWETFKQSGGAVGTLNIVSESSNTSEDKFLTTKDILSLGSDKMGICLDGQSNSLRPFGSQSGLKTLGVPGAEWADAHLSDIGSVKLALNSKANYWQGTWNPVIYCSGGGSNILDDVVTSACHWMRIGSLVMAFFSLEVRSWPTSYTGQTLLIKGIPYPRNTNKFATGVVTRYYGSTNNLQADIISLSGHDTSTSAFWIHRSVTGMGTYGNISINWMNQTFGLAGYIMYSL